MVGELSRQHRRVGASRVAAPLPNHGDLSGHISKLRERRSIRQATAGALPDRRYTLKLKIGDSEWVRADQTAEQALVSLNYAQQRLYTEIHDGIDTQQDLEQIRKEQLVTASISSLLGDVSLPDVDIWDTGLAALDRANVEIRAGRINDAVEQLQKAARNISQAKHKLIEYREGSISGAERAEVGLEVVQTAAAVTVSIGTGGLAGVAVGAGYGAAQTTARQASEVALGLGEEIDWGGITFDTLFGLVTGILGGKLGQKILKVLLKNPAVASLGRKALSNLVSDFVSGRVSTILHTAGRQVFDQVRGKQKMTAEGFLDAIVQTLTDPKQIFLDLLLGVVHRRGAAAMTKRKTPSEATPDSGKPEAHMAKDVSTDAVDRAGVSRSKPPRALLKAQKAILAGESVSKIDKAANQKATPSEGGSPRKEVSSSKKATEDKTDQRGVTEADFGDVTEHLKSVREGTGPMVGRRLGEPLAPAARKPSLSPRNHKAPEGQKAEQAFIGKMRARRRAEGTAKLDDPTLRAVVRHSAKKKQTIGDKRTTLQDLAADNPEFLTQLWKRWKAGKAKGEIKLKSFKDYVQHRMGEFRGAYGEDTLAFKKGPDEIIVKAKMPRESVTTPGSDAITYRMADDKIVYYDNKAFGKNRKVSKVSALEWNLPDNMEKDIVRIETDVGRSLTPPEIAQMVLPRLKAAHADVSAYVAKLNPKPDERRRQLRCKKNQKALGAILKKYGIERVVSTEGGAPDMSITGNLSEKGFKLAEGLAGSEPSNRKPSMPHDNLIESLKDKGSEESRRKQRKAPPLKEHRSTEYGRVNIASHRGDLFEGHEVLTHQWLKLRGIVKGRRGSEFSKFNSVIALTNKQHKLVSKLQRAEGLYDEQKLAKMSAEEILEANANILLQAEVPPGRVIQIIDDAMETLPAVRGE